MKTESDPITEDEWLLRRVHKMRFRTDKVPVISPTAFEPRVKGNDPDTDGISLYRAACLNSPGEILSPVAPEKRHEVGIVRIQVKTLREAKLGVKSEPDSQVKGHVVLPDLNAAAYAAKKSQFTSILLALAHVASLDENVVLWPSDLD